MPSSMRAATALLLLPAITAPVLAHGHHDNRPPSLPFTEELEAADAAVDAVAIQFETPCFGCAADEGEVGRLLFEFSADGAEGSCSKSVLKLNGQELGQEWEGEDSKGEGSLIVQLADDAGQREVGASWRTTCLIKPDAEDREVMQVFAFTIHSVADVQVPEDFGFQIFLRQSPRLEIVNIEQLPLERDADGDDHEHEHHGHHGDHHHDDTKHLEKILRHEREELHHLEMRLDHLIRHIEHKKADIRKLEMNPRLIVDEVKQCSGLNCVFATVSRKGMMIFEYLGLSLSHGSRPGPPPPPHGWVEGEVHDGPFGPDGHEHGPDGFEHHGPPPPHGPHDDEFESHGPPPPHGPHDDDFEHRPHHHHDDEEDMDRPGSRPHHGGPPPPSGMWDHHSDEDFRPEHFDHHHGEHGFEDDEEFDHPRHHEHDEEFDHHRHHDEESEHMKPEHHDHHGKKPEDKAEKKPEQHSGFDHHDHEIKPHDREHKNKDVGAKHNNDESRPDKNPHSNPNFHSGDGPEDKGKDGKARPDHGDKSEDKGKNGKATPKPGQGDKKPGPPPPGPPPPHGPPPPGPPPPDGHPPGPPPPHGPPPPGPPPPEGHPPGPPPPHGPPPPGGPPPHHNETEHPHPGPPPPPGHGDHPPPGPPPGGDHGHDGDHPHPGPPGPPFDGPGHGLLPFNLGPFHFFAAFLLLLTGSGLLFKLIRSRLSPSARATRAQIAAERRNARRARRAGRMHRWSAWWNRYREPTDRADYEEKAALILEQEGLLEEAMDEEMGVAMTQEAAAPAVVEHRIVYTPAVAPPPSVSTLSSSNFILTPTCSELDTEPMLPSYEQELDDEIHVVDGFNYTPSTSSASDAGSLYHSRQVSIGTDSGRDEKR